AKDDAVAGGIEPECRRAEGRVGRQQHRAGRRVQLRAERLRAVARGGAHAHQAALGGAGVERGDGSLHARRRRRATGGGEEKKRGRSLHRGVTAFCACCCFSSSAILERILSRSFVSGSSVSAARYIDSARLASPRLAKTSPRCSCTVASRGRRRVASLRYFSARSSFPCRS